MLELVECLEQSAFSSEIVYVDDASGDETPQLVEQLVHEYGDRIPSRAIYHERNTGRGRAVTDGMRLAQGRFVGYLDIDLEVHAHYIPRMVHALERGADVAIAERHYRLSPSPWFVMRHVLSRGYRALASYLMDLGGLDTEAGFKFFARAPLLELLDLCEDPGWFWDTEIMAHARRRSLRIVPIPCLFLRRSDKTSTLKVIPATLDYLRKLYAFRRAHPPMKR